MKRINPVSVVLSYPFTWVVVVLLVAATIFFNSWFQPPLFNKLLVVVVDIGAFALWFFLAWRLKSVQKQFNTMPYEKRSREVTGMLKGAPGGFKQPALACMKLIDSIHKEFSGQAYSSELDLLVSNIYHLTVNHKQLYNRFTNFGTTEQKHQMKSLLDQQTDSMSKIHETLQAFSGNLTILAANADKAAEATNELKYINDGLKEVIEVDSL